MKFDQLFEEQNFYTVKTKSRFTVSSFITCMKNGPVHATSVNNAANAKIKSFAVAFFSGGKAWISALKADSQVGWPNNF